MCPLKWAILVLYINYMADPTINYNICGNGYSNVAYAFLCVIN